MGGTYYGWGKWVGHAVNRPWPESVGGINGADTVLVRFGARDYDPNINCLNSRVPIAFNGGGTIRWGETSVMSFGIDLEVTHAFTN